jgi:hypothetical protein
MADFTPNDTGKVYCEVTAVKAAENQWFGRYLTYAFRPNIYGNSYEYYNGLFSFYYDPSSPLDLRMILSTPNNACFYRITIGNLFVEYDVD